MLTVSSSTFYGNIAYGGGGISNLGTLEMTDSFFVGNTAYYIGGCISNTGSATVEASTFSSNSASDYGGCIWNGSALILLNSHFSGNRSSNGRDLQDDGEAYLSDTALDN
jgi:hypothetical protein